MTTTGSAFEPGNSPEIPVNPTTTYRTGGPPFLRHPNGRGKLFDDAEANLATYIDKTSSASGSAKLRDCRLVNDSHADGKCQVYGGEFSRTRIHGGTIIAGRPEVKNSILDCSEVSGKPYLNSVVALGTTEICDRPQLSGGLIGPLELQNAILYGEPFIRGSFTVTGRVHDGVWTRAPKHVKLPWCDLSECIDGKLLLNCYCRPVVWWLKFGPKVAKKWDWNQDMVDVTLDMIRREFT